MADVVRILKDIEISDGTVLKKGELHEVWLDDENRLSIIYNPTSSLWLNPDEFERVNYFIFVLDESTDDYIMEEFTTEDEAIKHMETLCEILNKKGEE